MNTRAVLLPALAALLVSLAAGALTCIAKTCMHGADMSLCRPAAHPISSRRIPRFCPRRRYRCSHPASLLHRPIFSLRCVPERHVSQETVPRQPPSLLAVPAHLCKQLLHCSCVRCKPGNFKVSRNAPCTEVSQVAHSRLWQITIEWPQRVCLHHRCSPTRFPSPRCAVLVCSVLSGAPAAPAPPSPASSQACAWHARQATRCKQTAPAPLAADPPAPQEPTAATDAGRASESHHTSC